MGIMMPETCWVNLKWINIFTCVIHWFFLLLHWEDFFEGGALPPEVCPSIICTPHVRCSLFTILNFQENTYREHVYNSMGGYKVTPIPHFRWRITKKGLVLYTGKYDTIYVHGGTKKPASCHNLSPGLTVPRAFLTWFDILMFLKIRIFQTFLLYFLCLLCHGKWVRHHGMARPQFADGGMASSMEGGCEYIEQAVADSWQGVVFHLAGLMRC